MQNKPELLLPVGNVESFYAALQGGADAIYLGLKQFNARGRASNFTNMQLLQIIKEVRKKSIKVYITLNTVIKNNEITSLIEYLHFLNFAGVDGIIIQDWGVFYIARNYFPNLKIHASTQLGIHNSLGVSFSDKKGFRRVVLARELTLKELENINKKSKIKIEVFIHGALCYSFSGMCLYSSYSGGWGANRGLCTQPCRRTYKKNKKQQFLFNLKDNQLLDYLDDLIRIGVSSLKIEGRMKSGEYTFRVAKAYRLALDYPDKKQDAKELLEMDFGREKTSYFLGKDIKHAVSSSTVTGILLGKVVKISGARILISSKMKIEPGFRLRFHQLKTDKPETIKVKIVKQENDLYWIDKVDKNIKQGSDVYLSGIKDVNFPSKLEELSLKNMPIISSGFRRKIVSSLKVNTVQKREEFYFRINSMEWLRKVNLNEVDGLFLSFSKITWKRFNPDLPFIQKFRNKIYVELPKFIPEDSVEYYSELVSQMVKSGIRNFVISHLSQKILVPKNCRIFSNENVYVFNDAAAKFINSEGIKVFTYPQEIDFETLFSLSNKEGIVPVYFHPELFHSRMPIEVGSDNEITDDTNLQLTRYRRNGITSVVPNTPVAIFQSKNKLKKNGFYRYLIDVSFESPSKNRIKTLKNRLLRSEQIQPSITFNFVKGMK
ncbi:MAG: U32 family peptidase [Prolixibacteraceae bacterium]|jgi:U32 family peptidase|nr:U32 family peptidase [Prolixibacteraceae bacterium]MBT6006702.1 U32 family peptidase [Prolixibacteraceae bacterium]MBT6766121.1 U32 family peptidase [Prolixibacteraceae bacterium]MBT7000801.1 U32 family peptidase [Prolixibacteraceae bacterium]MBT7393562.1 U32 family peptidase [Prolixibacteraceae bacterium]